jgi:hypothetical protein
MSYDPRCEELARYFLAEGTPTPAQIKQLSQGIQDYIEDFIHGEDLENEANKRTAEEAR